MARYLESGVFSPSADITGNDLLVKLSSGQLVVTAADTDEAYGILPDPTDANVPANVITCGECYAIAGGTIAAGAALAPDADGEVKTAATGDAIVGEALEAAVAGDRFLITLSLDKTRLVA